MNTNAIAFYVKCWRVQIDRYRLTGEQYYHDGAVMLFDHIRECVRLVVESEK